jgi:hypothetical protein
VEERVVQGGVSVGRGPGSTLIIPSEALPARWRLFDRRRGHYRLRLSPAMEARVARGGEVTTLAPAGTMLLPDRARGKIVVGEVTILFQLMAASAGPRIQLPLSLRRAPLRELDPLAVFSAAVSVILHAALVLYLRSVDWPRRPDVEENYGRFVHQTWRRPPPPVSPAPSVAASPAAVSPPVRPARPPASLEVRRRELVERVGRSGLIQVLTGLGRNTAVRDLLRDGSVDRDQALALREVGGLNLAQDGPLVPIVRGGGRIADVTALRGQTHIAVADVGGGPAERRVPVVRVEPPADSEAPAGFDPQLLARAIKARLGEVRACYERALKRRGDLGGKLVLRFTLTPAGTVAAVDIDEDTLHDAEVAGCVRSVALRWRFPTPPRAIEISFPFLFQPAS